MFWGYVAMPPAASITPNQIAELADMFRMMADASRLAIILACLEAPISVSEIAARTGLSANLVSHHLRLLRAARILRAERRGKQIFYAEADQHIRHTIGDMVAHVTEPRQVAAGVA
ncbi:MAG TPA: metalloregulator ArsR/SmtB family transcription factor [Rhodopila sp.]|nr:metalloregulator ArsR/SmtB family transcription factor [Rhodopila sp.]